MGSWLQEAIEDYSLSYPIKTKSFDVNGWRMLCTAFVDYLKNLELTEVYGEPEHDAFLLRAMFNAERHSKDIINVVKFLEKSAPPTEWIYEWSALKERAEVCEEMEDALMSERLRMYENMWENQLDTQSGE